MEEELLHRVVVKGAIDVHRADAGPVHAGALKVGFCVQLALQEPHKQAVGGGGEVATYHGPHPSWSLLHHGKKR